jgi:hypothetical protein
MTQTTNQSVFQTLSTIGVKEKVERKGNLDYLSWANAWAMLKTSYPSAQRKVYESEHTGFNYFTDGRTAWVKVGITVEGLEHIDYLPVMDFRNNAISVDKLTAMDVNKTIQRSTAKAIAMHGLGLSLWTGEDVPEAAVTPMVEPKKEELKKDSEEFKKVKTYIEGNKSAPFETIIQQVSRKYVITPAVQKDMEKIHKA